MSPIHVAEAVVSVVMITSAVQAMNPPKSTLGAYAFFFRFSRDVVSRLTPFIGQTLHVPIPQAAPSPEEQTTALDKK